LVDLLTDLCTSENDLTTDEDQKDDLGLDHAVDETREQLRFIGAEIVMLRGEALESNGELDVARAHDVLDLKVGELRVEAEFLDDTGVLARRKLRVVLRLGTCDNHLAARENEGSRLRVANTHDDGGETLRIVLLRQVRP